MLAMVIVVNIKIGADIWLSKSGDDTLFCIAVAALLLIAWEERP